MINENLDNSSQLRGVFSCSNPVDYNNHQYNERKNTHSYQDIIENVRFILKHFEEPLFPRTVSTYKLKGCQIKVDSLDQVIEEFEKSSFIDCRINAFPAIDKPLPNFIFIDVDDENKDKNQGSYLIQKLEVSLSNVEKRLDGFPSVLSTGNGYHIYQPLSTQARYEDISDFGFVENPSNKFLRFAKDYLSSGYADKCNNPSLKSCLLRVPGTFNSKCVGIGSKDTKVKIVQEWNEARPSILDLSGIFYSYLISNHMKETKVKEKAIFSNYGISRPTSFDWIEKLLKTAIADYRKYCIWRILLPYLINIRKVSEREAFQIVEKWLEVCSHKRKIDFDHKYLIKINLKNVKRYRPVSLLNLKKENPDLYDIVKLDGEGKSNTIRK